MFQAGEEIYIDLPRFASGFNYLYKQIKLSFSLYDFYINIFGKFLAKKMLQFERL